MSWEDDYTELFRDVCNGQGRPNSPYNKDDLEGFLSWLGQKAKDRAAVEDLIRRARERLAADPSDVRLIDELKSAESLLEKAQGSGVDTVRKGLQDLLCDVGDGWPTILYQTIYLMKPLYAKAIETQFNGQRVRAHAYYLLVYCISDLEFGFDTPGKALYHGRVVFDIPIDPPGQIVFKPSKLFYRRSERKLTNNGSPLQAADVGLASAKMVLDECRYWEFPDLAEDVINLMEDFYRDVICLNPTDKGHRWYLELAKKYNLPRGIAYNEGFYATLFGKVQIETHEGLLPAAFANVVLRQPRDGEELATMAHEDGTYQFANALLHKRCSPFMLSATYEEGSTVDLITGPLDEPDPTLRFEKDLKISLEEYVWQGSINREWIIGIPGNSMLGAMGGTGCVRGRCTLHVTLERLKVNKPAVVKWPAAAYEYLHTLGLRDEEAAAYSVRAVELWHLRDSRIDFEEQAGIVSINALGEVMSWRASEGCSRSLTRPLSSTECSLTLTIDHATERYRAEGQIRVSEIPTTGRWHTTLVSIFGDVSEGDVKRNAPLEERVSLLGQYPEKPHRLASSLDSTGEAGEVTREFALLGFKIIKASKSWELNRAPTGGLPGGGH